MRSCSTTRSCSGSSSASRAGQRFASLSSHFPTTTDQNSGCGPEAERLDRAPEQSLVWSPTWWPGTSSSSRRIIADAMPCLRYAEARSTRRRDTKLQTPSERSRAIPTTRSPSRANATCWDCSERPAQRLGGAPRCRSRPRQGRLSTRSVDPLQRAVDPHVHDRTIAPSRITRLLRPRARRGCFRRDR